MPDLNDHLRRDGARWREEVDRRPTADADAYLDRITAAPVADRPLRDRFSGRAPLLLSMAAVTVAALTVGGVVLASGVHHPHAAPPPSGAAGTSPSVSVPPSPSIPSSPARTTPHAHRSTSAHHRAGGTASATASTAKRHPTTPKHHHPAGGSGVTTTGAAPIACEGANLTITVSSPTSTDDRAALTVAVRNSGTAPCTISGFPAVQLAGDSTISATPTTDTPAPLTLAGSATASAEVDWVATSPDGPCPAYPTTLVSTPAGGSTQGPLDPAATVCDAATLVVHPLTAS